MCSIICTIEFIINIVDEQVLVSSSASLASTLFLDQVRYGCIVVKMGIELKKQ